MIVAIVALAVMIISGLLGLWLWITGHYSRYTKLTFTVWLTGITSFFILGFCIPTVLTILIEIEQHA